MSSNTREIKDVFYLVALQGINYAMPLIVFPYLMVTLGAEKFGYIGFATAVTQYLMLIVDFGFNLSATKRIALAKGNQAELNNIFTSTLYAKVGLLVVSFLVLFAIAQISRFEIYRETLFVMFLTVVGNTFTFVWLFQGLGQIRFVAIFNAIAKLSILPLTFIFVKNTGDYLTAALLQSLVSIFAMFVSVGYVMKSRWVKLTPFVSKNIFFELKESFPLFFSSAATSIYMVSFVVMLGYFSTPEAVGQYSAVEKLTRAMCLLVIAPIAQAFYPKISQLGVENKDTAILLVRKILLFTIACTTIVFFVLFFFSPYIVLFLGKDYQNSLDLFKIMSFIPLFSGVSIITAQLGILALGNSADKKNYQRVCFIAGIVALISIFAIIPCFYAKGAAISLLLTEVIICVLMLWYGRNFLKLKKI